MSFLVSGTVHHRSVTEVTCYGTWRTMQQDKVFYSPDLGRWSQSLVSLWDIITLLCLSCFLGLPSTQYVRFHQEMCTWTGSEIQLIWVSCVQLLHTMHNSSQQQRSQCESIVLEYCLWEVLSPTAYPHPHMTELLLISQHYLNLDPFSLSLYCYRYISTW